VLLEKPLVVFAVLAPVLVMLSSAACSQEAAVEVAPAPAAESAPAPAAAEAAQPETADAFPQAVLANEHLRLTVYLPDAQNGYYRGTRFDWSGLVARVEFAGHTAFAEWRKPHNPNAHDHVVGPAEEFGMESPLGYDEAQAGEPFYKIGVGALEKPADGAYKFHGRYRLRDAPAWKVTRGEDRIEFVQELAGERGWAYEYAKRITLDPERAAFTIHHALRNTGSKAIETDQYCHNFIVLDDEPVGPGYRVTFPFAPTMAEGSLKEVAEFQGRDLVYMAPLPGGKAQWARLAGFEEKPEDNRVAVTNTKTGAQLEIGVSLPPTKVVYFAQQTAACPEFFVSIRVAPGEKLEWASTYQFEVVAPAAAPVEVGAGPAAAGPSQ
jgi:hypothetical protein